MMPFLIQFFVAVIQIISAPSNGCAETCTVFSSWTAIMVGNTDSTHYLDMTQNVYRFSPTFMYPIDIPRFHGVNERISVKNYGETVNFFYHVMINADKATLEPLHKHGEEF